MVGHKPYAVDLSNHGIWGFFEQNGTNQVFFNLIFLCLFFYRDAMYCNAIARKELPAIFYSFKPLSNGIDSAAFFWKVITLEL